MNTLEDAPILTLRNPDPDLDAAEALALFERMPPYFGRFMAKVVRDGVCWRWIATTDGQGYGAINIGQRPRRVHRIAYEMFVGPIPDGLVIDHLCCNRLCVNPEHLEPVTFAENVRRGARSRTACKNGHPYTPETTYRDPRKGHRLCRICRNNAQVAHRKRVIA